VIASSNNKATSRRAKKAAAALTNANASSGDEATRKKAKAGKSGAKKMRKWDADGLADEGDDVVLDYSATSPANAEDGRSSTEGLRPGVMEDINPESFGTRTGKGQFVLKDLDDEVHSILQGASAKKVGEKTSASGIYGSSLGAISNLFRNVVGGKILTKEDLSKPMKGMEEHLLKKNVAREAAVRLCEGVERELIGVKTGSFESAFNPPFLHPYLSNIVTQVSKRLSAPRWNPPSGKFSPPPPPSTFCEQSRTLPSHPLSTLSLLSHAPT
jgi:signal recognition particle receptor subunit alpha